MQCEELRTHFADYLADKLSESYGPDIERHLLSCESCSAEIDGLRETWMKLGSLPVMAPDSSAMQTRFRGMLDAYHQGMDHAPAATWWDAVNAWMGKWWPRQPALQFGFAVALLIVGVVVGQRVVLAPVAPQPSQDLNELRGELRDMRQMVALSLMQQQSATERLRGVSWSNRIEEPDNVVLTALLDTLMHDPNVNVRLASVDALRKFGQTQMVRTGVLQALMQQASPLVQVALIDFMVELKQKESTDTLRRLVQDVDADMTVRDHAAWGLENLE